VSLILSEIHKFLFEGLPVRGVLVRLTDAWQEVLTRRNANTSHGDYPPPVQDLLGELAAAAVLLQSNIKFDGALVLQIFGDGPVKLAVVEVSSDFGLRATATVVGPVAADATFSQLVNVGNTGRCAITLDPKTRQPGQQPYQGVVPLSDAQHAKFGSVAAVLQHYMLQSEQLDTMLVLASDDRVAAGLLIQRLPVQGVGNLAGNAPDVSTSAADPLEDYRRIATLAASLKATELRELDAQTVLYRLFWEEKLLHFVPLQGAQGPHFSCTCSRERVARMILGLGADEAASVLQERPDIEVGCDFCGAQYHFDAVDVAQIFHQSDPPSQISTALQ